MEKRLCPQNKQLKGGLRQGEGWQAPGDPDGEKNLNLLTQRAKGVEGCSFPPLPPPLLQACQFSSACLLGALE